MTKSLSNEAFTLVQILIQVQKQSRKLDVVKGRVLWQLKANNLYKKAFGEGVDTWEEFLRSPEIALTTSEANRAMQMYEYFVIKYEIAEDSLEGVPIKSLHHMLPRLKNGEISEEDVPELVESARNLTFNQFKERLYDIRKGEERTYKYLIMRKCNETNNLSRVQTISHEDILKAFPEIDET